MQDDKALSFEKALSRAQSLCARQEKCTNDLRSKMKQWHVSAEDIEKVVKRLIADGFVNDERYAHMFTRDKSKLNKWGSIKIVQALKTKRIPESIIRETLADLNSADEEETLNDILKKKAVSIKAKSASDLKNKLIRFGVSRGFNIEMVIRVVNQDY